MGLSRIRGQDRAIGLLTSAFEADRLSHAYLLHGPDGVGKEATALELAKALNCEAGGLVGCGECRACGMAERLGHPDIHLIFPAPRDLKTDARAAIIAGYVRDGYRDEEYGRKSAIISVEMILSEVVVKANQRPFVGPWKIFVIADADKMTTEAANTLLKTLEEPPAGTVIVLTTSRPSALPTTVISRCQKIQFARLPREIIEEILLADDRLGFDKKTAHAAAALAQGSVGRAVRVGKEGLEAELSRVALIAQGKRVKDVRSLVDEAQTLAFRLGRKEQEQLLDLLLLWFRDVLLMSEAAGAEAEPALLYSGHKEALSSQAREMDFGTIRRLIEKIDEARGAIERYSNASIVFTAVLLEMAIARKRSSGRRETGYAT